MQKDHHLRVAEAADEPIVEILKMRRDFTAFFCVSALITVFRRVLALFQNYITRDICR